MRKLFYFAVTIALLFVCLTASAQGNWVDCVYLKNGSIIKGTIVEQIIGESVKIQTTEGSVFVYQMSDVLKITKESQSAANPYEPQRFNSPFNNQQSISSWGKQTLSYEWDERDRALKLKYGDTFLNQAQVRSLLSPTDYSAFETAASKYKSGQGWIDAGGWGWGFALGSLIWMAIDGAMENEDGVAFEATCLLIGFYWGLIADVVGWAKRGNAKTSLDGIVDSYNASNGYGMDIRISPSVIAFHDQLSPGVSLRIVF